jgi:hypothetical protein
MTRMNTTEANAFPARRSTDYITPADRMAEAAALLLDEPCQHIPALIAAMRAAKGPVAAQVITALLAKEAAK